MKRELAPVAHTAIRRNTSAKISMKTEKENKMCKNTDFCRERNSWHCIKMDVTFNIGHCNIVGFCHHKLSVD